LNIFHFPESFLESIKCCSGYEAEPFEKVHLEKFPISIRNNPFKKQNKNNLDEVVPWCENGFYLNKRPEFVFDPCFHGGAYYVQEASSMFLYHILKGLPNLEKNKICLDVCSAPGGKATIISDFLNNQGLLVANEVIKSRSLVLKENIIKWNSFNAIITNNDPSQFGKLKQMFDLILVDAPCSGSGLFRKDPNATNEWTLEGVKHCALRQKRILADVLPSLKNNGHLIYSTCSYSEEENEQILDWLTENFNLESKQIEIPAEWGIVESRSKKCGAFGYRFYPNNLKGEGFFISLLLNKEATDSEKKSKKINKKNEFFRGEISNWLSPNDLVIHKQVNGEIFALPKKFNDEISLFESELNVINSGTRIGKMIHDELIPDHQLALSHLVSDTVMKFELDLETSIKYLRKDSVRIETEFRGWALVRYSGINLGWVKILNNRINNNYPKEWRILKDYKN
jgi:NOL1/NOP2/sun family putative RNA methylase